MGGGKGFKCRLHLRLRQAGAAGVQIGVQHERFDGGRKAAVFLQNAVKELHLLACPFEHLRGHGQHRPPMHFTKIPNAGVDGEKALAAGDIGVVGAHQLHHAVGGPGAELEIGGLVHVTVIVGPGHRHGAASSAG